ncbi:MAG: DMT family transporter [Eubacteriales bacterium]|jgi:drug/metabolite transporter (DMT)-like permease
MKGNWKSKAPQLALFTAALIWGSSFVVVKNSVDTLPPNLLLAFRFTTACVLLGVVFYKRVARLEWDSLWRGLLMGVFLFAGYSLQTIGITGTTPGKNAFLTAIYCVLVPFFSWFATRQRPDGWNLLAALLCILGVGLVALDSALSMAWGDAVTLAGGVMFACHIVAVATLGKGQDPILMTILQFFAVACLSWTANLIWESFPTQVEPATVWGVLYLALFATALCLLLQNIGQRGTDPAAASILLCLESVFGVLFSVVLYHEQVTLRMGIGFVVIFCSVILSETKLSFLRRSHK